MFHSLLFSFRFPHCIWNSEGSVLESLALFLVTLCSLQDLSSSTRDQTWVPAVKELSSNHWTAKEFPLATYLNDSMFSFIWNILTFFGGSLFGYLFHHMTRNGAINSFFMLQPERTFQHTNMILLSVLLKTGSA